MTNELSELDKFLKLFLVGQTAALGANAFAFFFGAGFAGAGCFYLRIPEFIGEIEFQLPAFGVAGGAEVLAGKSAGGGPMLGKENIAYREFYQAFFVPYCFLDAGVEVAEGMGFKCTLPDGGRSIEAGKIGGPV